MGVFCMSHITEQFGHQHGGVREDEEEEDRLMQDLVVTFSYGSCFLCDSIIHFSAFEIGFVDWPTYI